MTGIGAVHGRLTAFAANDATVRGGTYYPITGRIFLSQVLKQFLNCADSDLPEHPLKSGIWDQAWNRNSCVLLFCASEQIRGQKFIFWNLCC